MKFIKVTSNEPAVNYITETLKSALLAGKQVLWVVCGGSAIPLAAEVSRRLRGMDLHNLMMTLTDERFGPVGNADSNWLQLANAGFALPGAQMMPVLDGHDQAETVQRYGDMLRQLIEQADFKFGLFGMGPDGHTAGNLPSSPTLTSLELAGGYDAGQFIRLTMTPLAITRLDEVVLYAVGTEKQAMLDKLDTDLSMAEQPAQILKKVPKLTVFNDYKGEAA